MVAESWFRSLQKTSKKHEAGPEKAPIGVLAFEVASLMSKLVHLWHSLSDKQVNKSREEIVNSMGIRKLVSDDDDYISDDYDYIVGLICAEMIDNLEHVAIAVARLAKKCTDPYLKTFENAFGDLTKTGADPYKWLLSWKKMDRKVKKMERFILVNANLYQEMETLSVLEQILRRMKGNADCDSVTLVDYEKKVAWKYHEVEHLKEISLWNRTYNYIVRLLARSVFTVFRGAADIDLLLGSDISLSSPKNRLRNAPQETLGAAALALHYANVIIVIEKLAASPHLIGHYARDNLYNMLPKSVRKALRARLRPYSKSLESSVYDTVLAGEWTDAMSAILEWLAPLAHNTVRWQSERSFEHQNLLSKTNVLLVQTLHFANQEKTEATITELLVGLNYIWRFGRELSAKALLECDSGRTFGDSFEG